MAEHCQLLVVGGGPGGYAAAIKAGQLGIDTILVEKAAIGGTCLNVGCIPSKALIHVANDFHLATKLSDRSAGHGISTQPPRLDLSVTQDWKNGIVGTLTKGVSGLLRKVRVRVIQGDATFLNGREVEVRTGSEVIKITSEHKIVATGSVAASLTGLPFGSNVLSSTEALELRELPGELIVVGAGYIGLELGIAFRKLGSKVTVVEAAADILPIYDAELTKPVRKRLAELGIDIICSSKVTGLGEDGRTVHLEGVDGKKALQADKILVTIGRKANTQAIDDLKLAMNGPFVRIDDQCRTSMKNIFAIGDVTGEPMLAHRAMAQGTMVAELIAGKKRQWHDPVVPAVCFTDPEIVSVGLSPAQAKASDRAVRVGTFPFVGNGRSLTTERTDGFIRVTADEDDHRILGVQAVGEGVSELSSAFVIAIEMNARLEDVAAIIHAHPTRSEAFQESAMAALGEALHI